MKFSRCFYICEAACVLWPAQCWVLQNRFSLEANRSERHILSAEGKVGSLLLTYHLMRCLPISLLSSSSVVFLQVSQLVMNQLPFSKCVVGFFLECFTAFWGAVLSYCMYYRVLESAEVSSKPNNLEEKPQTVNTGQLF